MLPGDQDQPSDGEHDFESCLTNPDFARLRRLPRRPRPATLSDRILACLGAAIIVVVIAINLF